jgi:hypothetical protein
MIAIVMRRHSQPRGLDWACAAMVLALGLVLALPGDTLDWSSIFWPLSRRFPEEVWAAAMIVLGLVRSAALIINGRLPTGSPLLRGACAAMTAVVWSQFLTGDVDVSIRIGVALPGVAFYLVLIACEIVTASRAYADLLRVRERRVDC